MAVLSFPLPFDQNPHQYRHVFRKSYSFDMLESHCTSEGGNADYAKVIQILVISCFESIIRTAAYFSAALINYEESRHQFEMLQTSLFSIKAAIEIIMGLECQLILSFENLCRIKDLEKEIEDLKKGMEDFKKEEEISDFLEKRDRVKALFSQLQVKGLQFPEVSRVLLEAEEVLDQSKRFLSQKASFENEEFQSLRKKYEDCQRLMGDREKIGQNLLLRSHDLLLAVQHYRRQVEKLPFLEDQNPEQALVREMEKDLRRQLEESLSFQDKLFEKDFKMRSLETQERVKRFVQDLSGSLFQAKEILQKGREHFQLERMEGDFSRISVENFVSAISVSYLQPVLAQTKPETVVLDILDFYKRDPITSKSCMDYVKGQQETYRNLEEEMRKTLLELKVGENHFQEDLQLLEHIQDIQSLCLQAKNDADIVQKYLASLESYFQELDSVHNEEQNLGKNILANLPFMQGHRQGLPNYMQESFTDLSQIYLSSKDALSTEIPAGCKHSPNATSVSLDEIIQERKQGLPDLPVFSKWECLHIQEIRSEFPSFIKSINQMDEGLNCLETSRLLYADLQKRIWEKGIRHAYLPSLEEFLLIAFQDLQKANYSEIFLEAVKRKDRNYNRTYPEGMERDQDRLDLISSCEASIEKIYGCDFLESDLMFRHAQHHNTYFQQHAKALKHLSLGKAFSFTEVSEDSFLCSVAGDYAVEGRSAVLKFSGGDVWRFRKRGNEIICEGKSSPNGVFKINPAALYTLPTKGLGPCIPLVERGGDFTLLAVYRQGAFPDAKVFPLLSMREVSFKVYSPLRAERDFSQEKWELFLQTPPPSSEDKRIKGGKSQVVSPYQGCREGKMLKNIPNLSGDQYTKDRMIQYNLSLLDQRSWKANLKGNQLIEEIEENHWFDWRNLSSSKIRSHIRELQVYQEGVRGYFLSRDIKDLNYLSFIQGEYEQDLSLSLAYKRFLQCEHLIGCFEEILRDLECAQTQSQHEEIAIRLANVESKKPFNEASPVGRIALLYQAIAKKTLTFDQVDYLGRMYEKSASDLRATMLMLAGTGFGKTEMLFLFVLAILSFGKETKVCCSTIYSGISSLLLRFAPLRRILGDALSVEVLGLESLTSIDIDRENFVEELIQRVEGTRVLCISDRERLILAALAENREGRWRVLYNMVVSMSQVEDEIDSQVTPMSSPVDEEYGTDENSLAAMQISRVIGRPIIDSEWVRSRRIKDVLEPKNGLFVCSATISKALGMAITRASSYQDFLSRMISDIKTGVNRLYAWLQNRTHWVARSYLCNIEEGIEECHKLSLERGGKPFQVLFIDSNNQEAQIDPRIEIQNVWEGINHYNQKKLEGAKKLRDKLSRLGYGKRDVWFTQKRFAKNGRIKEFWARIGESGDAVKVSKWERLEARRTNGRGIDYFYSYEQFIMMDSPQIGETQDSMGHVIITDTRKKVGLVNIEDFLRQLLGRSRADNQLFVLFRDVYNTEGESQQEDLELDETLQAREIFEQMDKEEDKRNKAIRTSVLLAQVEIILREALLEYKRVLEMKKFKVNIIKSLELIASQDAALIGGKLEGRQPREKYAASAAYHYMKGLPPPNQRRKEILKEFLETDKETFPLCFDFSQETVDMKAFRFRCEKTRKALMNEKIVTPKQIFEAMKSVELNWGSIEDIPSAPRAWISQRNVNKANEIKINYSQVWKDWKDSIGDTTSKDLDLRGNWNQKVQEREEAFPFIQSLCKELSNEEIGELPRKIQEKCNPLLEEIQEISRGYICEEGEDAQSLFFSELERWIPPVMSI